MEPEVRAAGVLYHLALVSDWQDAQRAGEYRMSTIGRTLEEEGFIHTSFAEQVQGTAEAFYRGRDVVLLSLDPEAIPAEIKVEEIADGRRFPHIHGPIPLGAVIEATPVLLRSDGSLELPDAL